MPVSTSKPVRRLLEMSCEFQIGIRKGYVLELRSDGYLVMWEEWVDPETGEVHEKNTGLIAYGTIARENEIGTLTVIRRPQAEAVSKVDVRRSERTSIETERMQFRKHYALAAHEMLQSGELKLTRDDFEDKFAAISLRGRQLYEQYIAEKYPRKKPRGGSRGCLNSNRNRTRASVTIQP